MNAMHISIAIDGPAGAGKSTVARGLAKALEIAYLDTGAMYRALAWVAHQQDVDFSHSASLERILDSGELRVEANESQTRIFYREQEITLELHGALAGRGASLVAVHPGVRNRLVAWQRQFAASQSAVLDGRDIGSVVLTDATLKVFLTASTTVRAQRRYQEFQETSRDSQLSLEEIEAEIIARDERDKQREFGALQQADDALYLDGSFMTAEEIIALLLERLQALGYHETGEA